MNKRFEEQLKRDPILREMMAKLPSGPLRKPKPKTEVRAQLVGKIAEAAKAFCRASVQSTAERLP
jgi:hypothetical protein